MHKYDYSFLEGFPLPEDLSGLLDCLHGMQKRSAHKPGQEPSGPQPDFSGLPVEILDAYSASGADPLLLVPCVVLDVLCALPEEQDAQGKAVELAKSLLERSGYPMCRYFQLDEAICTYRYFYHRALGRAAAHWEQNGSAYLYYIEIFLSLLYLCGKNAPSAPTTTRRSTKRAAIEALVLQSEEPISKAEICAALPDVSPTTVEAALGAMVREGRVRRVGAARSARYIRA